MSDLLKEIDALVIEHPDFDHAPFAIVGQGLLRRIRAALAASATAHRACPCLHATPCDPACTCVNPASSRGCRRCCSYGSAEQQRQMAEHLVASATAQEEMRKERDGWRKRFGLQTSGGWQTAEQAEQLHQETYRAQHRALKSRAEQADARLAAMREALEQVRWVHVLCGACGDRYEQCRACGEGTTYSGARWPGTTDAQCGGHPVSTPHKSGCVVDAALAAAAAGPEATCSCVGIGPDCDWTTESQKACAIHGAGPEAGETPAPTYEEGLRALGSAMKKVLPPKLLAEVIAHLDPLTPFMAFLRTWKDEASPPSDPPVPAVPKD